MTDSCLLIYSDNWPVGAKTFHGVGILGSIFITHLASVLVSLVLWKWKTPIIFSPGIQESQPNSLDTWPVCESPVPPIFVLLASGNVNNLSDINTAAGYLQQQVIMSVHLAYPANVSFLNAMVMSEWFIISTKQDKWVLMLKMWFCSMCNLSINKPVALQENCKSCRNENAGDCVNACLVNSYKMGRIKEKISCLFCHPKLVFCMLT